MQDRVPLYPGRVKLTPVAGQENVYDMVRADQPTQEGTPLNKNSLLKDATAALFQLSGDTALPDKVFEILSKAALVGEDGGLSLISGGSIPLSVSGNYTGNGKSGSRNPTTLTFTKKPKLVVIQGVGAPGAYIPVYKLTGSYTNPGYYVGGNYNLQFDYQSSYATYCKAKYDDALNILSFYYGQGSEPKYQANINGNHYEYYVLF